MSETREHVLRDMGLTPLPPSPSLMERGGRQAMHEPGDSLVSLPARLETGASCILDAEGHCITCSDEALEVRVLSIDAETGLARVAVKDVTEEVDITLVESVVPGDLLLVHGGVAIAYLEKHASNDAGASSFAQDA
jgi:hydrogenase maturation factor